MAGLPCKPRERRSRCGGVGVVAAALPALVAVPVPVGSWRSRVPAVVVVVESYQSPDTSPAVVLTVSYDATGFAVLALCFVAPDRVVIAMAVMVLVAAIP